MNLELAWESTNRINAKKDADVNQNLSVWFKKISDPNEFFKKSF